MIHFATIALLAWGSLGPVDGPETEDWAGLDRELAELTRAASGPKGGPRPTIRFQIVGAASDGEVFEVLGVDELGVQVRQLQLGLRGEFSEHFSYLIRFQARSGQTRLQAARVEWHPTDQVTVRMGNLRLPVIHSRNVPRPRVLFIERSEQARTLRRRDGGAELSWSHPRLRAVVGAHNGGDGFGSDLLLVARVEGNLIGEGAVRQEYSPAVDAETVLLVGLGLVEEGSIGDGTIWIADAVFIHERLYLHGEVLDYGDGFGPGSVLVGPAALASGSAGRNPFSTTLGVRLDEIWDVAARFEWLDDSDRTWDAILGANRALPEVGARLQLNWTVRESDAGALTGQRLALGVFWSI